jgi:integrase
VLEKDAQTFAAPQVTRVQIAGIVNAMDGAGRSPKTIKNTVNLLASCLAVAVDEGHIARNPAKKVRLPRTGEEVREDTQFLTHEDFARVLAEIPADYQPLVLTLVGSGLRWSEATALQAKHINVKAHTIAVRQAWKRVSRVGFEIGPPKTAKSRRTVNPAPQ